MTPTDGASSLSRAEASVGFLKLLGGGIRNGSCLSTDATKTLRE
jgi:hypothetical protein